MEHKVKKDYSRLTISVWLMLLWFFSGISNSVYFDNGTAFLVATISLLVISGIMIAIPYGFYCKNNKRKLEYKNGKRICFWNSAGWFIVSVIVAMATRISLVGGLGVLMFYFINKWTFVETEEYKNKKSELQISEGKSSNKESKIKYHQEGSNSVAKKFVLNVENFEPLCQQPNDLLNLKESSDSEVLTHDEVNENKSEIMSIKSRNNTNDNDYSSSTNESNYNLQQKSNNIAWLVVLVFLLLGVILSISSNFN